MGGKKIYHAGDTGLFLDMQLIGDAWGPLDVAVLPIGDNFTMGIDDAVRAAGFLKAKVYIPMHYETFEVIKADPGKGGIREYPFAASAVHARARLSFACHRPTSSDAAAAVFPRPIEAAEEPFGAPEDTPLIERPSPAYSRTPMADKLRAGIVGATGMVGQRFVSLLADHPWFQIVSVAASERSAGKSYAEAVGGRWAMATPIPASMSGLVVKDASKIREVADGVDLIFCAVDMPKEETRALEEAYAKSETPVISNNSAHRMTPDVPMMLPEINPHHLEVIQIQRKRLGVKRGFITVKPNCSIQSYVPALHPLREFGIEKVFVCTYQAISGASKTFKDCPEMVDNVIPFIGGEEEKSEIEPMKVWGSVEADGIMNASSPTITSQCIRVPVTDGHLAAVFVSFQQKPPREKILELWKTFEGRPQKLGLPSAPRPFLRYFEEENRPQTRLDRDAGGCKDNPRPAGMGITIGRLRDDRLLDYRFVCLSHNTIRGAAGGAVLTAELLKAEGYLAAK